MQAPTHAAGSTAVPLNRSARRFNARHAEKLRTRVARAMPQATRGKHTFATAKQQVHLISLLPRSCVPAPLSPAITPGDRKLLKYVEINSLQLLPAWASAL